MFTRLQSLIKSILHALRPSYWSAATSSHSALPIPQSTILNPQSTILNPQSSIKNPPSTILNPQSTIRNPQSTLPRRGQSFLEMAVILPVLLITVVGMTEIAFFVGRYLDAIDLTREAARFASQKDLFDPGAMGDYNCSTPNSFNFWYDTACIFSPPSGSNCPDTTFCNGFNPYIPLDLSAGKDDVVIEAFTVAGHVAVVAWPQPDGYWALSDHDSNPTPGNWKTDCHGHTSITHPYYTLTRVNQYLQTDANTPTNKGFVAVEFYYCYHQVLNLPIVSNIIPNPLRIHVYTLMPLPASAPTATPYVAP